MKLYKTLQINEKVDTYISTFKRIKDQSSKTPYLVKILLFNEKNQTKTTKFLSDYNIADLLARRK